MAEQQWRNRNSENKSEAFGLLLELYHALHSRYECLHRPIDIKYFIIWHHVALIIYQDTLVPRAYILLGLGKVYARRFEDQKNLRDIDNAINCLNQASALVPGNHPERPTVLNNLGHVYHRRFEHLGGTSSINLAIEYHGQAVATTPIDHLNKASYVNGLGASHIRRFESQGDVEDLEKGIGYYRQAVDLTPHGHTGMCRYLHNLGTAYAHRFKRFGRRQDGNDSIRCASQTVELSSDDHEHKLAFLENLGSSFADRFQRFGRDEDIDESIRVYSEAMALSSNKPAERVATLCRLGHSHLLRFKRLGGLSDLSESLEYHMQALAYSSADSHENHCVVLSGLGSVYLSRFEVYEQLSDISKAAEYFTDALSLTPNSGVNEHLLLNSLGTVYRHKFERFGQLEDAEEAIRCQSQAAQTDSTDYGHRAHILNDLGASYLSIYVRYGRLPDAEKAIALQTESLRLTQTDDSALPIRLNNLGRSYQCRFGRLGGLLDIDKAIEYQRESTAVASNFHKEKPIWLSNLGISYEHRFLRLHEITDIDMSIHFHNQAVILTPDDHADKPRWLGNLGGSYRFRFQLLGDVADIEKAIVHQTNAIHLASEDYPIKPMLLRGLGSSYAARFDRFEQFIDINEAIDWENQALVLLPDDHARRPSSLSSLGDLYLRRFVKFGDLQDVEVAISLLNQSVLLFPDGHPEGLVAFRRRGDACFHRFVKLNQSRDLQIANANFRTAAEFGTGSSHARFMAGRQWATTSRLLGVSTHDAYHRVMSLIPELIWLGSTIIKRYDDIKSMGNVTLEAVASAISVGAYGQALEWLEQGRTIVWQQVLQLRTPFDKLAIANPLLARRLNEIAHGLQHAGFRGSSALLLAALDYESHLEREAHHHHRLAAEWDELVKKARLEPGFDDFMRPRSPAQLMRVASDGPIVVVNIHASRCDALIISPNKDSISHVPLENFSEEKAMNARVMLQSVVKHRSDRAGGFQRVNPVLNTDDSFKQLLRHLWLDVVKPILGFLGYTCVPPTGELPHVTWCTTGPLSFLPLHAAGNYDGIHPNAFDLIVSSYTPTLSALLQPSIWPINTGVLAVGQEYTSGLSHLPNTVKELATIHAHAISTQYLQLDGLDANVDAVLTAMEEYGSVHLACHASQNQQDPSLSSFHLSDGNLTLSTITQRSFKNKGLAFLSACQTAAGDASLPDEAVHLAAGMQMAGYRSVIATMWSIYDDDAPELAHHVYADLLKDGGLDHRRSSRALHKAVGVLQSQIGEAAFARWVPFIHMGI